MVDKRVTQSRLSEADPLQSPWRRDSSLSGGERARRLVDVPLVIKQFGWGRRMPSGLFPSQTRQPNPVSKHVELWTVLLLHTDELKATLIMWLAPSAPVWIASTTQAGRCGSMEGLKCSFHLMDTWWIRVGARPAGDHSSSLSHPLLWVGHNRNTQPRTGGQPWKEELVVFQPSTLPWWWWEIPLPPPQSSVTSDAHRLVWNKIK